MFFLPRRTGPPNANRTSESFWFPSSDIAWPRLKAWPRVSRTYLSVSGARLRVRGYREKAIRRSKQRFAQCLFEGEPLGDIMLTLDACDRHSRLRVAKS